MAAEAIIVYIDPAQLEVLKGNNYSLYLAKKVNGVYIIIWQSKGPLPSVGNPGYEYMNYFDVTVPSYNVNFGTVMQSGGAVSFTSAGQNQPIEIGQTVILDANGHFGTPQNNGTPGTITIQNQLQGNPHEILSDAQGNVLFVNVASGMDVGDASLTPIDTYQIWFDNYQNTGTIIAHNPSNPGEVVFDGTTTEQTITYNINGQWLYGPPPPSTLFIGTNKSHRTGLENPHAETADPVTVTVIATLSMRMTVMAVGWVLNNLVSKFTHGPRPSSIKASVGGTSIECDFQKAGEVLAVEGTDAFMFAVKNALIAAVLDPTSHLQGETWTLSEPSITVTY